MEKVVIVGLKRKKGYLYFIDKDGDISRVKLCRGITIKKAGRKNRR